MQGSPVVIEILNRQLTLELTSMDVYLHQGRMLGDWGYEKLKERLVHESDDERRHADLLIQRILFLEGVPNVLARRDVPIGTDPKTILENDLRYEFEVAKDLNSAMAVCVDQGDNASRVILEELLKETEDDHINWLESQLFLIENVGLQNYLAQQL